MESSPTMRNMSFPRSSRRTFQCRKMWFMKYMWKTLVQCHIDYCSQLYLFAWDLQKIEYLQRICTTKIPELKTLNYWQKLKQMKAERYKALYIRKILKGLVPNCGIETAYKLGLSCAKLRSCSKLAYPADFRREWFYVYILFVCEGESKKFKTMFDSMSLHFHQFGASSVLLLLHKQILVSPLLLFLLSFLPIRVTWNNSIFF